MTKASDLRAWETLSLAAQVGSMTAAAAKLGLSVAAVSQQISRLERTLERQLLIRDQHGIRPTPAGEVLISAWAKIAVEISDAKERLSEPGAEMPHRVNLASVPTATASVLPQAINIFRRDRPSTRIEVLPLAALAVYDAVSSRKADVGLAWHYAKENLKPNQRLAKVPVFEDPLGVIASVAHPLAGRASVTFRDLAQESFIGRHRDERGDVVLADAARSVGFSPKIDIRTNDVPETQGLVAAGMGIAVTYGLTLLTMREDICVLPLVEDLLPPRRFEVIWLNPELRSKEFLDFAEGIRSSAREYYHHLNKRIGTDWSPHLRRQRLHQAGGAPEAQPRGAADLALGTASGNEPKPAS